MFNLMTVVKDDYKEKKARLSENRKKMAILSIVALEKGLDLSLDPQWVDEEFSDDLCGQV